MALFVTHSAAEAAYLACCTI